MQNDPKEKEGQVEGENPAKEGTDSEQPAEAETDAAGAAANNID